MQQYYEQILEQVESSKEKRIMFAIPATPSMAHVSTESYSKDMVIYGEKIVVVFPNQGKIAIQYESKDQSHPFQMLPDRSVINIKMYDVKECLLNEFSDSWDEGNL